MNFANNLFLICLVAGISFILGYMWAWSAINKKPEELQVYGCQSWTLCGVIRGIRRKWRTDMLFYFHWFKLRKPRKAAIEAAENTI